jgi:hypothetical protein
VRTTWRRGAVVGAAGRRRIDVDPEGKTCAKVLLHEMSHAVGNVEVPDSPMIMGRCDPAAPQTPPIPCDPEGRQNLMTATEVKEFCGGSF